MNGNTSKKKKIKSVGSVSVVNAGSSGGFMVSSTGSYWTKTAAANTITTTVEIRFTRSFAEKPQVTYGIVAIKHADDPDFEIKSALRNINPAGFDVVVSMVRGSSNKKRVTVGYSWMAIGVLPEVPQFYVKKP